MNLAANGMLESFKRRKHYFLRYAIMSHTSSQLVNCIAYQNGCIFTVILFEYVCVRNISYVIHSFKSVRKNNIYIILLIIINVFAKRKLHPDRKMS